jgi:hypothetical protein
MGPQQRRDLFLEALGRTEPLTHLAARQAVSRKFVYQQMAKATAVVDQAFQPAAGPESEVLFQLPVTQDWLEQLVLSLTLSCHRRLLRNQRTVLLAFVEVLQEKLAQVAQRFAVPLATVPALCEIEALDPPIRSLLAADGPLADDSEGPMVSHSPGGSGGDGPDPASQFPRRQC